MQVPLEVGWAFRSANVLPACPWAGNMEPLKTLFEQVWPISRTKRDVLGPKSESQRPAVQKATYLKGPKGF